MEYAFKCLFNSMKRSAVACLRPRGECSASQSPLEKRENLSKIEKIQWFAQKLY